MVWTLPKQLHDGEYTVEIILGQERFGITYLAKDKQGNGIVIKTLDDDLRNQPEFNKLQKKFVQEAFKLNKCQHPNIVRLLKDPFQEDDLWCLAMEYIAGINLARRSHNILTEKEALHYIQQIGEALTVVHKNNLVHRDVKPANIMIKAGSTQAVLIDFGLARGFDSKKLSDNFEKEVETGYTPPELYSRTVALGAYTDVYSLAATLYNLLTGQIPVSAKKRLQSNTLLPEPKELNPQISNRVNRGILWAMELEPKNRPQSIQRWLDSLGLQPQAGEDAEQTQRPNYEVKNFRVGLISLIVAVVAILTGIFQNDIRNWFIKPTPTATPTKPVK